jgi:hypothetical protein
METVIMEWDGRKTPDVLRSLPPGRYLLEPLDEPPVLTPEERAGIMEAMDELDAGGGSPLEEALQRIQARLAQP